MKEHVVRYWAILVAALAGGLAIGQQEMISLKYNELEFVVRFEPEETATCWSAVIPAPEGLLPAIEIKGTSSSNVNYDMQARIAGLDVARLTIARPVDADGKLVNSFKYKLRYPTPVLLPPPQNAMAALILRKMTGRHFSIGQTGYLIIVPDDFYSNILPLAEWKRRQGHVVWIRKTSETGSTREQIRDYVRSAFRSWTPTPSYLLLVGAANKIQPFVTPGTSCVTDHLFVCIDGDDYLADMFVGRLPAANASELDAMVAKIIGYEATPFVTDTTWFSRALMVGTSYQEGGSPAVTALVTLRQIREKLLRNGYSLIDTVFYPPTLSGRGPVDSAVNRGVLFVNGRGWGNTSGWGYPQFNVSDVFNLANSWRLPVVTSIYCGTGNFVSGITPCFGEAWLRAGTPTNPKGGVAFWGSSYTGTSTRWNNCMAYGIYHTIFDENITTCAQAMYAGKLEQLLNFPLAQDSFDLRLYFHVYNLLGDPAMEMWTRLPRPVQVVHPEFYPVGTSAFNVRVTDYAGRPVQDAKVCLYAPDEVHELAFTNSSGWARFAIPVVSVDTMFVTVTGQNLRPYLGTTLGIQTGVFVGHLSHSPDTVSPGDTVPLTVFLKNFGNTYTARDVHAILRNCDSYATILDSVSICGDLAPGEIDSVGFRLRLSPAVTNNQRVRLLLAVSSLDSVWESALELTAAGPALIVTGYTVHDGNGVLDPGDTAEISVTLFNRGELAQDVTGLLCSANPAAVTILDSLGSFGTIQPGDSGSNANERFRVRVATGIGIGRRFSVKLILSGATGFASEQDMVLTIGTPTANTPLGPDYYGYYCYDNTDAGYPERPLYSWIEIDPGQGGSGTRVDIGNDRAVTLSLPFTFRFYGVDYDRISVSDNGYVAMGTTTLGDPYNWTIPSASGPDGLCAVFWDDFRVDTLGVPGVFVWYDQENHRFVVEWSRCRHVHGFRNPTIAEEQTFELILLDPAFHQTVTGDGAILFQYQVIQNDDSATNNCHNYATVGIQAPSRLTGLEYTFAGRYPAAAAVLEPGRVIKFTTNPPDTFTAVTAEPKFPVLCPQIVVEPTLTTGETRVTVDLSRPGYIRGFDASGRQVWTSDKLAAGRHELCWNCTDYAGRKLPAGIYYFVLTCSAGNSNSLVAERVLLVR